MEFCSELTTKGLGCSRKAVKEGYCTFHYNRRNKVNSEENKKEEKVKEVVTITFGEVAENHVGMQKIGTKAAEGFTVEELEQVYDRMKKEYTCELIDLNSALPEGVTSDPAAVLIIRNYVDTKMAQAMFEEQLALSWDTKAKMKGRVVNKVARYNLCYDLRGQEPDYENGKGRVVAFKDVPLLDSVREGLVELLGDKATGLKAEGNLYYDASKTGIGWHSDAERKRVVAFRLGNSMNLCYIWFHRFEPVGEKIELMLHPGDLYIMSEKAVGNDGRKSSIYTLRHAAGCEKYTKL